MSGGERNLTREMLPAQPAGSSAPIWLKRLIQGAGLILLIFGLPVTINLFCILPLALLTSGGSDGMIYGVVSLAFALLTVGVGGAAFLHANNSLHNKPSKPFHFPSPPWLFVGCFGLLLALGLALSGEDSGFGIFFSPILVTCAILPPLWAVAWMIPPATSSKVQEAAQEASTTENVPANFDLLSLSWRRGLLSFAGGATVGVFIAIALEILLPVIILSLVFNLADTVSDQLRWLFRSLSNAEVAEALTSPGFIFVFVHIAVIAPLAEEVAKPLVTLPLLRSSHKQEAFWLGALAGAGFAALENVIYATGGLSIWAGILLVRALGSALHPLGSGLVAQGWWGVLRGERDAGVNWLRRFALAMTMHALWNGGSLLVITLGGAGFFGKLPPEIGVLGLSAAGTTLAFLLILGIAALWVGRAYGHDKPVLPVDGEPSPESGFLPSDRALALWGVVCLIAFVPAGIAGLKLWLR